MPLLQSVPRPHVWRPKIFIAFDDVPKSCERGITPFRIIFSAVAKLDAATRIAATLRVFIVIEIDDLQRRAMVRSSIN